MRVTIVVTGIGDFANTVQTAEDVVETATKDDGDWDYQKLEKPTIMRQQANNVARQAEQMERSMDYLDIPTFLRRKEQEEQQ